MIKGSGRIVREHGPAARHTALPVSPAKASLAARGTGAYHKIMEARK